MAKITDDQLIISFEKSLIGLNGGPYDVSKNKDNEYLDIKTAILWLGYFFCAGDVDLVGYGDKKVK